jgi:transcription antitermination factor NusG
MADQVQFAVERWYAVSVGSRHEKVAATHLRLRGLTCFLPTYRSVRRWRDRRKELDMVLFPGYVFVNLDLRNRLRVLQAPRVLRFVTFQGHPAPLKDSDMESLALGLAQGTRTEPHPYLQRGRRVRVVRGPLANTEGILVRRKERFRLVLSI